MECMAKNEVLHCVHEFSSVLLFFSYPIMLNRIEQGGDGCTQSVRIM